MKINYLLPALILLIAAPVFAQNLVPTPPNLDGSARVNASVTAGTRVVAAKSRADKEIQRRVAALTDLNTNVQAMSSVSATIKANLASTVSTQISNLNTLKAKVDAGSDINILKADAASITASYRIFALVVPQARIVVAADKLKTASNTMFTAATALKAHADGMSGDHTVLDGKIDDMFAKIGDANLQSDAAVSEVVSLTPDQGDKGKMAGNDQALKDARAKLRSALQELRAARADMTLVSAQ